MTVTIINNQIVKNLYDQKSKNNIGTINMANVIETEKIKAAYILSMTEIFSLFILLL